ncbi:MAG: flagellar basal body rod protein FlgB [Angelakisella sp.]
MRFDSVSAQAMQKSLDAIWLKTKVISNNIANFETPGFKSQDVSFEEILSSKQGADGKEVKAFRTRVTQNDDTSIRPDGNNVNMEKEQMELWKAYSQYSYLVDKVNGQYNNLRYVIKQAMK